MFKLISIGVGLLVLLTAMTAEARTHFNFGFGVNVLNSQPVAPYYVEDYYYPQETIVIQQDPYGRTLRETVYVAPQPIRAVHVDRRYPIGHAPRPFFSFGFYR